MRVMSCLSLMALLLANMPQAQAASIPSVSSVASKLEKRYNLNLGSIRNFGQSFNVSDNKKTTPEVSLYFSPSDPKEGEKITAHAFPIYFSNPEEALYFSWYLKRKDCSASSCDYNGDGRYNSEDWKIEAARILVQNGYDNSTASYSSDSDGDGYQARYGGDDKVDKTDYCYAYEPASGTLYELADVGSSLSFGCPAGTSPVCMEGDTTISASSSTFSNGDGSFTTFSESTPSCSSGGCSVTGTPSCSGSTVSCSSGTACCVSDPSSATTCTTTLSSCSSVTATSGSSVRNLCKHAFAEPSSGSTGDGSFGASEERFWKTDPKDPSTANNSKKDEANVAGLGLSLFTWNYLSGDQVGVAVEGTSMIPTKHADASYATMWAFPKNKCYPGLVGAATGSYVQNVKGYSVTFPTTKLDPNDCIDKNLVDPTEGGQATNLSVQVSASPENPVNDETSDANGDTVIAQASIDNAAQEQGGILYDWTVELDSTPRFASPTDITSDLLANGLVKNTKGNGLNMLTVKMDIPKSVLGSISGGIGYLRFKAKATESFEGGGVRRGQSDVVMKFTSTGKRISAYAVTPVVAGSRTKVKLDQVICNASALERTACRVIKNEIIGVRIDPSGLKDFAWTVNGNPLVCTNDKMSPECTDGSQNHVAFFPITGAVGDTYQVTLTANDITTGKTITLTRTFHIVEPLVNIVSTDTSTVWKKLLGYYKDVLGTASTACPSGLCPDYSDTALQAFSGGTAALKAEYIPSFLGSYPGITREWTVDGTVVAETTPSQISFPMEKLTGGIYDVSLRALLVQSDQVRRALYDIWQISPLDSTEIRFGGQSQIEIQEPILAQGNEKGLKKYYALISNYVPETVLFTFRMLLTGALLLFAVGFIGALVPSHSFRKET